MRHIFAVAATLAALVSGSPAPDNRVSYDGYHVYHLQPSSAAEALRFSQLFAQHHTNQAPDGGLEVAIAPEDVAAFEAEHQLHAQLLNADLGAVIRAEDKPSVYSRGLQKRGELPDLSWFETYHDYEDHLAWWDDVVAAMPGHAEKISLGLSYEGRDIFAFNLWGPEGRTEDKPAILLHATVHAREWISTMALEYIAYNFVAGFQSGNDSVLAWLDHYDVWMVPFHNPDGFVYTQTTDRMWRKNRQPRPNTSCGTDGNRNWRFEWDAEPPEGGSSGDPCSQTFRGRCTGDTPENQAISSLSDMLGQSPAGIRAYIDFHSYSQLILASWGFSCDPDVLPPTLPRMLEVAAGYAGAIFEEGGSEFQYGPGCEILYFSTGNSRDYHHGAQGADHSWTMELQPQSAREGGFVLPPERILGVGREQWAGLSWMLDNVWED